MSPGQPVRFRLTRNQDLAIRATERFVDYEGGIRAAKTTGGIVKARLLVQQFPGIACLLARWTEEDTFAQLAPAWRAHCDLTGLQLKWHADEGYDEVLGTGSRVYLCGLKTSDDTRRFAKLRGKTLAFIYIDQAEEMPVDVWHEVKGRLSQPGYPQQCLITPQPPTFDHWIADEFPEDNRKPEYRYIHTNVYDNRANIGDAYIAGLERDYPLGSAQRRTLLDGYRGLTGRGQPVYAGYFNRALHVRPDVTVDPHSPVVEAWDWGHGHPCVSWWQFLSIGAMVGLGAVMGTDMFLEDFVPAALAIRGEWIGRVSEWWSCGDPAGLDQSNQGTRTTKVREILASHGVVPTSVPNANQPEQRYQAIQTVSAFMRRFALDGQPAFRCHPRAVVFTQGARTNSTFLVDGFEAGYVWDDRRLVSVGNRGAIRVPKKDGYFDHCLHGDTRVITDSGWIHVRDLPPSGRVLSKDGAWCEFVQPRLTRRDADTVTTRFSDGSSIRCTPDHRIWTSHGWMRADRLAGATCYNAILQTIEVQSWRADTRRWIFRNLRVFAITCAGSTIRTAASVSTGVSGHLETAPSRLGSTSTTVTMIARIIRSTISNSSPARSTSHCTENSTPGLSASSPKIAVARGTNRRLGAHGTGNISAPFVRLSGWSRVRAIIAERPLRNAIKGGIVTALQSAMPHTGGRLVVMISNVSARSAAWCLWQIATLGRVSARSRAQLQCLAVEPNEPADVYCLTVPGVAAFAVESGIVVSNCQNTVEYATLSYGPATPTTREEAAVNHAAAVRGPRDRDPADRGYGSIVRSRSRGGY